MALKREEGDTSQEMQAAFLRVKKASRLILQSSLQNQHSPANTLILAYQDFDFQNYKIKNLCCCDKLLH
jgi:hypothetical protein